MTASRRELALSAAFAAWGLAIAIALAGVWMRPAPPGQQGGVATAQNFSASGPYHFLAGLILLPIVVSLLMRGVARLLAPGRTWSFTTALVAPLVALWAATTMSSVTWTIVPCALAIFVAVVLRDRDLHFTSADIVLVPAFLTLFVATYDALHLGSGKEAIVAAAVLFALRIAVPPGRVPPAFAFMLAPLGVVLETSFFSRHVRYLGWPAIAVVVVTPFVLRPLLRNRRRAAAILAFVVFPVWLYCYANATSLMTAEGKPRVDFFEDSHAMMPASEYLRGEIPYRDVLPGHGLLLDGGFELAAMKTGRLNIGRALKGRELVSPLNLVAIYAATLAATLSAPAALLTALFVLLHNDLAGSLRLLPVLAGLAVVLAAVRRPRRKWRWFAVGVLCVVAGVVSVDLAVYMLAITGIALARVVTETRMAPGRRASRLLPTGVLLGGASAALVFLVVLASMGAVGDFFRSTFIEVPAVTQAYTLNLFTTPPSIAVTHVFPDALSAFAARDAYHFFAWCVVALFFAVALFRRGTRRLDAMVVVAALVVVFAVAYSERHHVYWMSAGSIFFAAVLTRPLRRGNALAIAAAVFALILAWPATHISVVSQVRGARAPFSPTLVEIPEIPRARGALFETVDANYTRSAAKYVSQSLSPDGTFLDLTNRDILYFLLDRDCPIRQYEVAFYESPSAQREVIARIEANPRVEAVLMPGSADRFILDGIPAAQRAPLVWNYVQTHFHQDFVEGDVVFWRRNR